MQRTTPEDIERWLAHIQCSNLPEDLKHALVVGLLNHLTGLASLEQTLGLWDIHTQRVYARNQFLRRAGQAIGGSKHQRAKELERRIKYGCNDEHLARAKACGRLPKGWRQLLRIL